MMRYFLLLFWVALAPLVFCSPAGAAGDSSSASKQKKTKKAKERNVNRAAAQKRRELREMGVKNAQVKRPANWPRHVSVPKDVEVQEVAAPAGQGGFVFESNHFRYLSPLKLDPTAQKTVSRLCECAFAANRAIADVLPVVRSKAAEGGKKFTIVLAANMAAYHQAGGPQGSAGVFFGQMMRRGNAPLQESDIVRDQVLIPFQSLGLGQSGIVEREDIDTHALVHELTHQQFLLNNLPIWANEGWAEYVGYVPYVGETLDFDRGFSLILHAAKQRSDHSALDFSFSLEEFLSIDQATLYGIMRQGKDTYMLSTMLISFFVHLDSKRGPEALKNYLQALVDGQSVEDATKLLIEPYRSVDRLEQQFVRAWKSKKVKVAFSGK